MKPHLFIYVLLSLVGDLCRNATGQEATAQAPQSKQRSAVEQIRLDWEATVRPLLAKNCLECHSTIEHSSKLDLETIASLIRGGLSGSAIDLQNPAASLLLEVLTPAAKKHMPPEGQLNDDEIGQIASWLENFKQAALPKEWQSGVATSKDEVAAPAKSLDPISSLPLGLDPSQVIDLAIESAWRENGVTHAGVANDSAFARRLYLDLIGRIPLESELKLFVNNTDSRKREQLVDSLLAGDEHAQHMAEVFNAVLMARREKAGPDRAGWMEFLTSAIRENRPWNDVAREIVLARPSRAEDRGAVWYLYSRQNKHQDIAEAVSKDFFGVRIDCAQCHDHPLASEIEQRHYWGLVAFFNRSNNVDSPGGPRVAESAIGGFSEFTMSR